MNNTTSAITLDNAPSSAAELASIGRFQLRRLAEELTRNGVPIVDTDAKRQAFMQSHVDVMAETVYAGLRQYRDGSAPVLEVQPVVAARVEHVEEQPALVRQPRTSDAEVKPAVVSNGNGHKKPDVVVDLAALATSLSTGFANLTTALGAFTETTDRHSTEISELREGLSELNLRMDRALGLLLVLAENNINMSMHEVLQAAKESLENAPFPD